MRATKPQSPPARVNILKAFRYVIGNTNVSTIYRANKFSATGGLGFLTSIREVRKNKNNPENPVNPV
jgi:hypothetical protein